MLYMKQGLSYQAEMTKPKPCVPPVTMKDLPGKSKTNEDITTRSLQRQVLANATESLNWTSIFCSFELGADCIH